MEGNRPPMPALAAEIVTSGTEILLGDIVDTNAAWIAQQLRDAGVNLYYKTSVGDNEARLRGVIELGLSRSDVIIVTGGLGPTVDDVTRQAIAAATGRPLELHEEALETLRGRFARFGSQMTDNNRQQALIPAGATLIENPNGTAPGFVVETERGAVIALPGVPREMKAMMELTVLPYLRARSGATAIIRRRILRTIGIGESAIDALMPDLMQMSNPTVGLAAHTGQCDVRIAARAESEAEVEAMLDELEAEVRRRIGKYIYSATPHEPFAAVVARRMQQAGAHVAFWETNTAGQVAKRLMAADAITNPVVAAYTADAPPPSLAALAEGDALSEERAAAMALALADDTGAEYAVAILGSAGQDEGVYGSRSGETFVSMAGPAGVRTTRLGYGGVEEFTVVRTANQAMLMLWRDLQNEA